MEEKFSKNKNKKRAFSLIELLIVVAIIAIGVSIFLSLIGKEKRADLNLDVEAGDIEAIMREVQNNAISGKVVSGDRICGMGFKKDSLTSYSVFYTKRADIECESDPLAYVDDSVTPIYISKSLKGGVEFDSLDTYSIYFTSPDGRIYEDGVDRTDYYAWLYDFSLKNPETGSMVSLCLNSVGNISDNCSGSGPFSWTMTDWSECSASCGGGTQTKVAICVDGSGNQVADNNCDPASRPDDESQACNTQACETYNWKTGGWGNCNVVCGGGTKSRPVWCEDSSGNTVSSSNCDPATKPGSSTSCNNYACVCDSPLDPAICNADNSTAAKACQDLGYANYSSYEHGTLLDHQNCVDGGNEVCCDFARWQGSSWQHNAWGDSSTATNGPCEDFSGWKEYISKLRCSN